MSNNETSLSALTGVLVEAHNKGIDIDALSEQVSGGLMGGEMYASASADQKLKDVKSLKSALAEAKKLIAINA